jgi:protein-L-isoaspartate(D-aspartate) O-methyltransferase
MVRDQLERRGIRSQRVLNVMAEVPRERFLPPRDRARAYHDGAMSIGCGQTISQPYIIALMTEALRLTGEERVLEVGTGSGYQTAILAELAAQVYTIERISELSERAREVLCEEMGYTNVSFRVGDGTLGWPQEAPFDRCIVTAGAPHRPDTLLEQVAACGEVVVPVGSRYRQTLTRYRREPDGRITEEELCDCVFVQLIGEEGW